MEIIASNLNLHTSYVRKAVRETTVAPAAVTSPKQPADFAPSQLAIDSVAPATTSERLIRVSALPQSELHTNASEELIPEDSKIRLMRLLLEQLTGRRIPTLAINIPEAGQKAAANMNASQLNQQFNSLEITLDENVAEVPSELTVLELVTEKSSFSAQGNIDLADGRSITIDLETFQRSAYTLDVSANFQDPLVFQLAAGPLEFSDRLVNFDLDANGEKESIYFVTGDTSFLAVDHNRNGHIDNGAELFGALTGDGYQELAQYDEDGNDFIDEGDSIYSQLVLFNKNAAGSDHILSLRDAGVGAIYLQRVNTSLGLEKNGEMAGQVRASSIYLKENGGVGTTHQVDLVV
jgi:hypothetical protein